MKSFPGRVLAAATALIATLALAACGGGGETGAGGRGGGGGGGATGDKVIKPIAGAETKQISIGSKNFTEQYILGQIYAKALQAAGFKVGEKVADLGAEQVAYKSLKAGEVDAYPEYTGTALTSFFDVKIDDVPKDPDKAYEMAKAEYAKEGIVALPRGKFDNTYIVASSVEKQEEYGVKTLTELAKKAKGDRLSGFPECRQRTDCLIGLRQTYGFDVEFVSTQGQFEPIDQKQTDIALVFATDGKLSLTDRYATYEDDKRLFPPYNISLTMRKEAAESIGPEGQKVIAAVQDPLTAEVMRELNSRVDIDKQEPAKVAADYLKEAGFTK
jgi:glycine betaine/choline ABC-type transport system substrate-binding protein